MTDRRLLPLASALVSESKRRSSMARSFPKGWLAATSVENDGRESGNIGYRGINLTAE
jgi:hypothetical protein